MHGFIQDLGDVFHLNLHALAMARAGDIHAAAAVVAAGAAVMIVGFAQIKLDALHEPSHLEIFFATRIKRILVARSSRHGIA